ncbi:MAG: endo-1,4-beta-xylanase [Capsulimonadaceae bacterium]
MSVCLRLSAGAAAAQPNAAGGIMTPAAVLQKRANARLQPAAAPRDLTAGAVWAVLRPDEQTAAMSIQQHTALPDGVRDEIVVTVNRATPTPFGVQVTSTLATAPADADRIAFHFRARSDSRNPIRAVIETLGSPWTSVAAGTIHLTSAWQEYAVTGTAGTYDQPLAARLQVGAATGILEFTDLHVEDLGPDPALIEARSAVAPEAVQARIRRYRMGDLTVHVVDTFGHPVENATVHVRMWRQDFLFGCNFFRLDPVDNSPAQVAYRAEFDALFNYATLPFYWGSFEQQRGNPAFWRLDPMVDWCIAHGITPKAHPLVWHALYPEWAPADPQDAIPLLRRRVIEIVTRERTRIPFYDVVNEASNGATFTPANGESRWLQRDGAPVVVETALDWARGAAGAAPDHFIYNDYETGDPNLDLLTRMQHDGKLPDIIGIQSHMHGGVWPLDRIWMVCQSFSRFGRPIHFTETTVLSGPKRDIDFNGPAATDWDTTPDGEAAQADYVAKFYSILFSHPSVRAITWWDFSDDCAWLGAPAGLVRKDMTPKPAYIRLRQLIRHDWWTNADGHTDAHGNFTVRAFYGDYAITTGDRRGRSVSTAVSFPTGRPRQSVILRL